MVLLCLLCLNNWNLKKVETMRCCFLVLVLFHKIEKRNFNLNIIKSKDLSTIIVSVNVSLFISVLIMPMMYDVSYECIYVLKAWSFWLIISHLWWQVDNILICLCMCTDCNQSIINSMYFGVLGWFSLVSFPVICESVCGTQTDTSHTEETSEILNKYIRFHIILNRPCNHMWTCIALQALI
jgi:hypothetical protein